MKNILQLAWVGVFVSLSSSAHAAELTSKQVISLGQRIKTGYQAMTGTDSDYLGGLVESRCNPSGLAELTCIFKYDSNLVVHKDYGRTYSPTFNVLTVNVSYLDGIAGEKLYSLTQSTAERASD